MRMQEFHQGSAALSEFCNLVSWVERRANECILEMFNELMEAHQCTEPCVVPLWLQIHQHLLGDAGPFAGEILLHYLAHADAELYPGKPTQNTHHTAVWLLSAIKSQESYGEKKHTKKYVPYSHMTPIAIKSCKGYDKIIHRFSNLVQIGRLVFRHFQQSQAIPCQMSVRGRGKQLIPDNTNNTCIYIYIYIYISLYHGLYPGLCRDNLLDLLEVSSEESF